MTDSIYVAFLRGINVGGKNKLPMRDLSAIFSSAGCTSVETYIQSGNVICKGHPNLAGKLPAAGLIPSHVLPLLVMGVAV